MRLANDDVLGVQAVELEITERAAREIAFGIGRRGTGLANGLFEREKVVVGRIIEALHIDNDGVARFGTEENGAAIGLTVGYFVIIDGDCVLEFVVFVEHELVKIDESGIVSIDGRENDENVAIFIGRLDSTADGVRGQIFLANGIEDGRRRHDGRRSENFVGIDGYAKAVSLASDGGEGRVRVKTVGGLGQCIILAIVAYDNEGVADVRKIGGITQNGRFANFDGGRACILVEVGFYDIACIGIFNLYIDFFGARNEGCGEGEAGKKYIFHCIYMVCVCYLKLKFHEIDGTQRKREVWTATVLFGSVSLCWKLIRKAFWRP